MNTKQRKKLERILEHVNSLNLQQELSLYDEEGGDGWLIYTELFTDSAFPLTEPGDGFTKMILTVIDFVAEQAAEKLRQFDKRPITKLERAARDEASDNLKRVTGRNSEDDGQVGVDVFYDAGAYRPTFSDIKEWIYLETGLYGDELGTFENIPREAYEEVRKMVRAYMDEYRRTHA